MKYIKLFENWLNEADGGVKPFDPNKPGETKVVDITGKDMTNNPEQVAKILTSIFNRLIAGEDSPNVKETVKVTPFRFRYDYDKNMQIWNSDLDVDWEYKNIGNGMDAIKDASTDKLPLYLITPAEYNFSKDKKPEIGNRNKIVALIPRSKDKMFKLDDRFVGGHVNNVQFLVFGTDIKAPDTLEVNELFNSFKRWGDISFGNATKSSQSYQDIAKALGYEIPENYAPKQGVEAKK